MPPVMKLLLTLVVIGFTYCSSPGQATLDSLRQLLREATSEKNNMRAAYFLSHLGYQHYTDQSFDSALFYYRKFSRVRTKDLSVELVAPTLNVMGASYNKIGSNDSALVCYSEARLLARETGDSTLVTTIETNAAIIYKDMGLYELALETAFSALRKLEGREPVRDLGSCYNTIALVYEKTDDPDRALDFHRKALRIRKTIQNRRGEAASHNNIGETFRKLGVYDSALSHLERSLAIKGELNDSIGSASTLNNIGDVYLDRRQFAEAREYFARSLNIKRKANDQLGTIVTLNNLAKVEIENGQFAGARVYLREAEMLARNTSFREELKVNLELQILVERKLKNLATVVSLTDELFVVKDSLLNEERVRNLQSLAIEHETEKRLATIAMLEQKDLMSQAELSAQQFQIKVLFGGIILVLLLAGLLFQYYNVVKKHKAQVELLLRELHHRVKNNLQMLSSILSLQSQQLTDENALQAVRSNEGRIAAMALVHKKLYLDDENRSISVKTYITELIDYLVQTYGFHEKKLRLAVSIEEMQVDVDKVIPLGLILNELISNSFKHALVGHHDPSLAFSLVRRTEQDVRIEVGDNGQGIDTEKANAASSFGMKMVNILINQLRGRYEITNQPGTHFIIDIPLAPWKE